MPEETALIETEDRKPRCSYETTVSGRSSEDRPIQKTVRCLRVEEHHGNHQFDTEISENSANQLY